MTKSQTACKRLTLSNEGVQQQKGPHPKQTSLLDIHHYHWPRHIPTGQTGPFCPCGSQFLQTQLCCLKLGFCPLRVKSKAPINPETHTQLLLPQAHHCCIDRSPGGLGLQGTSYYYCDELLFKKHSLIFPICTDIFIFHHWNVFAKSFVFFT